MLLQWLSNKRPTTLLYSATRDGFSASSFHRLCDNKGKTVTIIRSTQNYIFGGYADQSWDSSSQYKNAPGCWIFTLTNPYNSTAKFPCTTSGYAMNCSATNGAVFGGGNDILVADNSNSNTSSHINLHSYSDVLGRGSNVFTGSAQFQTNEIEVYLVQ